MKLAPISKYARRETRIRWKGLAAASKHAAKHPEDPDAIHDLRVSIRRFTQCLRIFGQLLDRASVKSLRKRLRKWMDLCATARNCDVGVSLLHQVGIATDASIAQLKHARAAAEKELHRRLKKKRRRNPVVEAVRHPRAGEWKLDQGPESNLRRVLPPLAEDFFKAGKAAAASGASPRTMHQFRLRAKRFRYTLELFGPFYGMEMQEGAEHLKTLQDRLGAINDCATTLDLLARDPRAVAALSKLLAQREIEFREYWRGQFMPRGVAWWNSWLRRPTRRTDVDGAA